MANKTAKNLVKSRDQYNKYYGNFRGVDFSSDHTQVSDQRLAYSVNMYRDYQSAQGRALETIPGFRQLKSDDIFEFKSPIYGIHPFGEEILLHACDEIWVLNKAGQPVSKADGTGKFFTGINKHKSSSIQFNNKLYILDGQTFWVYDGTDLNRVANDPYIPTLYINTPNNHYKGDEYEQKNLLSSKYKISYVAGEGKLVGNVDEENDLPGDKYQYSYFPFNDTFVKVKIGKYETSILVDPFYDPTSAVMGEGILAYQALDGLVILSKERLAEDETIEITFESTAKSDVIEKCTIMTLYDERLFFSGNPDYPDTVFYCHRNSTGRVDPSYWGELNSFQDGIGSNPITGMITVTDTLVTLREGSDQAGFLYYHSPQVASESESLIQVTYPKTPGLNGVGCLGPCTNFLDDPVFISRFGLEGIGQLSVRYERAIEHRSSLIDSKLYGLNNAESERQNMLRNASITEWNGYLVILIEGKIFMADSRQRYTDENGVMQYEWYYLEDIGIYDDQTEDENGAYGGTFYPAVIIQNIGDNLYFGTSGGHFCCFNFDQRQDNGEFLPSAYTFNGRTIFSGCATKMDNCGIPHLTKSTVNKSLVVKTKSMVRSAVKIKVRTNKDPYHQIGRINTGYFTFDSVDFSDFTFNTSAETHFALKEKEKQWIEKQYFVYSDEFQKPFALYYIAYRYTVAGRIKS